MEVGFRALGVFILAVFIFSFGFLYLKKLNTVQKFFYFFKPKAENTLGYVLLFGLISLVFTLFFKPHFQLSDPNTVLEYAEKEKLHYHKFWAYYHKIQQNPYDYESIYGINEAHQDVNENNQGYLLNFILPHYNWNTNLNYEIMTHSGDVKERDLGFMGQAISQAVYFDDFSTIPGYLDNLADKNKPMVNYLYALSYPDRQKKIEFLKKEIELNGALDRAIEYLCKVCYKTDQEDELMKLYQQNELSKYIPIGKRIDLAYKYNHFIDFFWFYLLYITEGISMMAFTGMMLILGIWFYFLESIDAYEKEKKRTLFFVLFLGMSGTFLAQFPYSSFAININYQEQESAFKDLLYNIFVVGGIEEFVKILPLFYLVFFTKHLNEPIDYILFASLSALGFSVVEDLVYFNHYPVSTIYSRGIFTSLSHIADTSFIAYALVLNKYYYKKNNVFLVVGSFLFAILLHGLYDFFIVNEKYSIWIVPFLILMLQIWWFIHIINNCLNNAPTYSQHLNVNTQKLASVVTGGLIFLMLLVYLHVAYTMDEKNAVWQLFLASIFYIYPLCFLSICINRIDVFFGEWDRFSLRQFVNPKIFFGGENPKYSKLVGKTIIIYPHGKQTRVISKLLPLKAQIYDREKIGNYKGWFKIIAEVPDAPEEKRFLNLYFRTIDNEAPILQVKRNIISIYSASDGSKIEKYNKQLKDYKFIDLAEIKFYTEKANFSKSLLPRAKNAE